jgi:hypothetical protein
MTLFCRKGDLLRLLVPTISGWQGVGIAAEDVYDDDYGAGTIVPFHKQDDPDADPDKAPCIATTGDVELLP